MSLREIISAEIAANGPMRLDRYMELCLGHPRFGYYMRGDPFGRSGDFVTAPEISQMFGELIGLWAAQVWLDAGRPRPFRLIELGPGRGALAADMLRAAGAVPGFREAVETWLVETSPSLRRRQAEAVPDARWVDRVEEFPDGPGVIVANEFFDALPIRQFVRAGGSWRERLIGRDETGALRWGLGPPVAPVSGRPLSQAAPEGSVVEIGRAAEAIAGDIGRRLTRHGGAALIIDYGAIPSATGGGDTLQAVRRHQPVDPLESPGSADLTAHVDFAALANALQRAGAKVAPILTQGELLDRLGIGARAASLASRNPDRADEIEGQRLRLVAPDAMGTLFKALAAHGPDQPRPPGFDDRGRGGRTTPEDREA